jgi:predicted flap endonuclease-1-like 5' DNA nuclease
MLFKRLRAFVLWMFLTTGSLLGLLLWWWLSGRSKETTQVKVRSANAGRGSETMRRIVLNGSPETEPGAETGAESEQVVEPEPEPQATAAVQAESGPEPIPDDLQRIEGIGPKIAAALREAGVVTYAQLAASGVGRLAQIVREAGIRIAFPGTWPEQAALAAAGDWAALQALQSELRGGRRN